MVNRLKLTFVVILIMLTLGIGSASAASGPPDKQLLYFEVIDVIGDQTGTIDLVSVKFTFSSVTGQYTMIWTATEENPFVNDFRLNLNLFNPDTGTTAQDPSLFDGGREPHTLFDLKKSKTQVIIKGQHSSLLSWDRGDRVALSGPDPLGLPDGISKFGSAVVELVNSEPENMDYIGDGEFVILEFATGGKQ